MAALAAFGRLKAGLNTGTIRAAERDAAGRWQANAWVKAGILLGFRLGTVHPAAEGGPFRFFDKQTWPLKQLSPLDGVRVVPGGSSIRDGAYVAPGVVIMPPAFINAGAYVGEGTMVDSHALVGSCAQIGKRVHLSAGVQIGEPVEIVIHLAAQRIGGERIDREITPVEILLNRTLLHRRQGCGILVILCSRGGHIERKPIRQQEDRGSEPLVHLDPRMQHLAKLARIGNPISFHHQIQV